MAFKLEIRTGNAAFTGPAGEDEVARLLEQTAKKVAGGATEGYIMDINGNKCGCWTLRIEQGEE